MLLLGDVKMLLLGAEMFLGDVKMPLLGVEMLFLGGEKMLVSVTEKKLLFEHEKALMLSLILGAGRKVAEKKQMQWKFLGVENLQQRSGWSEGLGFSGAEKLQQWSG